MHTQTQYTRIHHTCTRIHHMQRALRLLHTHDSYAPITCSHSHHPHVRFHHTQIHNCKCTVITHKHPSGAWAPQKRACLTCEPKHAQPSHTCTHHKLVQPSNMHPAMACVHIHYMIAYMPHKRAQLSQLHAPNKSVNTSRDAHPMHTFCPHHNHMHPSFTSTSITHARIQHAHAYPPHACAPAMQQILSHSHTCVHHSHPSHVRAHLTAT